MNTLARRILAAILAALLLPHALPVFALNGETPSPPPEGVHSVHVLVEKEDPLHPGQYLPAEGILVSCALPLLAAAGQRGLTDAEGRLVLSALPSGPCQVRVKVEVDPDYPDYEFPEGYVLDDQAYHIQLDGINRQPALRFTLRLKQDPAPGEAATGGIRLQKAFYPYPLPEPLSHVMLQQLLVFQGEQLRGAEFIVSALDEYGSFQHYWNEETGPVPLASQATRYPSDADGRVLIEGLPEGRYKAHEVTPLAGCSLPQDSEGYGAGEYYWESFLVAGNSVATRHMPIVNAPEGFTAGFRKLSGGQQPGQPVVGARFVVYRLVDGQRQYLYYRLPLLLGEPAVAAFSPDREDAYELVSGYYGSMAVKVLGDINPSFFVAPALPSYLPGSAELATYYLEEVAPAPGYQLAGTPVVFNRSDALRVGDYDLLGIIDVTNEREPNTILVEKSTHVSADGPFMDGSDLLGYTIYPPGAGFMLLQGDLKETDASGPDYSDIRAYTGLVDGEHRFVGPAEGFVPAVEDPYGSLIAHLREQGALEVFTQPGSGAAAFHLEHPLPPGKYYVAESAWPKGYERVMPGDPGWDPALCPYRPFEHQGAPSMPRFTFPNKLKDDMLLISKRDLSGSIPLPGAAFILHVMMSKYAPDPDTGDDYELIEEGYLAQQPEAGQGLQLVPDAADALRFATPEDGIIEIAGLPKSTDDVRYLFSIYEVEAPAGYQPLTDPEEPMAVVKRLPYLAELRNLGPSNAPISLKAHKQLTGGELEAGQFSFELVQVLPDGSEKHLATASNDEHGDVLFQQIWVTMPLEEETLVRIREIIPPLDQQGYVRYSQQVCEQLVKLVRAQPKEEEEMPRMRSGPQGTPDIQTGVYAILAMILGDLDPQPCAFVNEMLGPAPIQVQVEASKLLFYAKPGEPAAAPLPPGAYSFTLSKLDPSSPGPASLAAVNDKEGKVVFPALTFDAPGTYRYLLREDAPGAPEVAAWDQRSFEVRITVEDKRIPDPDPAQPNGLLVRSAAVSYLEAGGQESDVPPAFVNRVYEPVQAQIELRKFLDGGDLQPSQFQFELWQDGALLQEGITHDANGRILVKTPPLTAPGRYTYQIREVAGGEEGYTYDEKTIYTAQVSVAADGDGVLTLGSIQLFKDGRPHTGDMVFRNAYASPTPTPTPVVTEPPTPVVTDPPVPVVTATPTLTPVVTDPPAPVVTATPTLTPVVTATPTPTPVVTNTPAPVVTPTPRPTAKPISPPVVTDPPVIIPSYPTLRVPLSVHKELRNGSLEAGQFSFELRDGSGRQLAVASNDAKGLVVFPDRTFSREVSNYLYTIRELAGSDSRISYDPTVYTVRVTTRAVAGQLQATVDIERDGTPYAGPMRFVNQRSLPPTGDSMALTLGLLTGSACMLLAGACLLRHRRRRGAQG